MFLFLLEQKKSSKKLECSTKWKMEDGRNLPCKLSPVHSQTDCICTNEWSQRLRWLTVSSPIWFLLLIQERFQIQGSSYPYWMNGSCKNLKISVNHFSRRWKIVYSLKHGDEFINTHWDPSRRTDLPEYQSKPRIHTQTRPLNPPHWILITRWCILVQPHPCHTHGKPLVSLPPTKERFCHLPQRVPPHLRGHCHWWSPRNSLSKKVRDLKRVRQVERVKERVRVTEGLDLTIAKHLEWCLSCHLSQPDTNHPRWNSWTWWRGCHPAWSWAHLRTWPHKRIEQRLVELEERNSEKERLIVFQTKRLNVKSWL